MDVDVDRLYQLPLGEFTAARDALAKRAGAAGPAIKALQKPNAAAWAVNQLYWHRRKTLEALMTAAARLRATHGKKLSGKTVDLAAVEAAHRAALETAIGDAGAMLASAGDAASPSTMAAVSETLDALTWSTPNGRLARPLKPPGFGALAELLASAGATGKSAPLAPPTNVVPIAAARSERNAAMPKAAEAAERAAEARRQEMADTEQELRAAEAAERDAERALARARDAVAHAEHDRHRLTNELEAIGARLPSLRDDVRTSLAHAKDAALRRGRFEAQLTRLRDRS